MPPKVTALVTVQVPDQDADYSDKAMRDAIATLALRDSVPDAEQLSRMPFKLTDFAGFSIDEVLPGRAVILVDKAAADAVQANSQTKNGQSKDAKDQSKDAPVFATRMFIAAVPGAPANRAIAAISRARCFSRSSASRTCKFRTPSRCASAANKASKRSPRPKMCRPMPT